MNMLPLKLLFLWLILTGAVAAQNCPPSIPSAGNPLCIPPDQETSPYYQGSVRSSPINMQWADRWGAIAIDTNVSTGGIGIAEEMESKRGAEQTALAQCHKTGGSRGCNIALTYFNQCAVIVWGDQKINTVSAQTVEAAAKRGMLVCNSADKNCQIYYSGCSLAKRIR